MRQVLSDERIKELRREARALNKHAKEKARASGGWHKMDSDDMADWKRYQEIMVEIERLKRVASQLR